MLDSYIYIVIVPISIAILLGLIFFFKTITGNNSTYKPKNIKNQRTTMTAFFRLLSQSRKSRKILQRIQRLRINRTVLLNYPRTANSPLRKFAILPQQTKLHRTQFSSVHMNTQLQSLRIRAKQRFARLLTEDLTNSLKIRSA